MITKGYWQCSDDCEQCEGSGWISTGLKQVFTFGGGMDFREELAPCLEAKFIATPQSEIREEA